MSIPTYPAYRDSGVAWLGQVPAGWSVRRLRFLADIRPSGVDKHSLEGELPVRLCNYVDVYKNDRITDALPFLEATATPAEIERFSLRAGDVLITKDSETPDDIAAAALVEPSAAGVVCGYHLALLRPVPGAVGGAFLFWAFKAPETLAQCSVRAHGITRFGLSSGAIGDVLLPLPPPVEQRAIASFLDRECGKIDALVAEQERLIALLKEKRQAVISHAVTKGLDPNAPMKESGVAWLGQVPAHWEVRRLKFLVRSGTSISYGIVQPGEHQDDGVPFVQTTNMSSGDFDIERLQRTTPEIAAAYPRTCLEGGEVLLGIRASIGAAHIAPDRLRGVNLSRGVARIVCNESVSSDFLVAALRSDAVAEYWALMRQGSTFNEVSIETVRELAIAMPPPHEQKAIACFVEVEARAFDTLTAEAERAIALLKERRAALISAAVIGRIDVRGLVSPAEAKAA